MFQHLTTKQRLLIVGAVLGVLLIGFVSVELFGPGPTPALFTNVGSVSCVASMLEDISGNGKIDGTQKAIGVPLEIQVDDPLGPNSGHFSGTNCYLTPTEKARMVHLHFTLPPGYKLTAITDQGATISTSTDANVGLIESTHFIDFPPQLTLLVAHVPMAASTPGTF